ncbi:MAG: hypothetical protein WA672_02290 [Candidatus Angelobacter sp.]
MIHGVFSNEPFYHKEIYQKRFMNLGSGEQRDNRHGKTRNAIGSSYLPRSATMIKIMCDVCNKVRPPQDKKIANDSWILGYDLEIENANALQRSLRFLSRWDDARVMELGAIHICSEKCKDQYIKEARAAA